MEQNFQTSGSGGWAEYLQSPTLIFSLILIGVYVAVGAAVGNFFNPIQNSLVVELLAQCDDPGPIFPWTLLTSVFLHANILHLASNIFFLLIFGFILEEHVSKTRWITAFLLTGLVGNLTFAAADLASFFVSPPPPGNPVHIDCGVGASGAVYGIMGTALGLRAIILIIFIAGLDIFAGGGFFAHFGGLITGLLLRRFWTWQPKVP